MQQHTERLQSAVDMARRLQRNEETTLKDRMEMVCTFILCACVRVYNACTHMGVRVSAGWERGRQGHEAMFQATHCTGMKGTGGSIDMLCFTGEEKSCWVKRSAATRCPSS